MAGGAAARVTSTSLLLAILVATTWCVVVAVNAPAGSGATDDHRGVLASRFVLSAAARRERVGRRTTCRPGHPTGACSGAGAGFIKCCGGACTDVLASASNCGACGRRCPFGRLCCGGRCAAVAYDAANCGACGRACAAGTPCTYGMCGYA